MREEWDLSCSGSREPGGRGRSRDHQGGPQSLLGALPLPPPVTPHHVSPQPSCVQGLHTSVDSINSPCVTCCHPLRRGTPESLQPVAETEPTPLPTAVPGC